jgi:hypothetical protein
MSATRLLPFRSSAAAQVKPTGYRIVTEMANSGALALEATVLLRQLLEQGAIEIEVSRRSGNELRIRVTEFGDEE